MHHGHGHGIDIVQWAAVLAAAAALPAVAVYLAAARGLRRRGDAWPWQRDACCAAGGVALAVALLAPLPGGAFTVHMTHPPSSPSSGTNAPAARPLTRGHRV